MIVQSTKLHPDILLFFSSWQFKKEDFRFFLCVLGLVLRIIFYIVKKFY